MTDVVSEYLNLLDAQRESAFALLDGLTDAQLLIASCAVLGARFTLQMPPGTAAGTIKLRDNLE